MRNTIEHYLAAPTFPGNEDKNRSAYYIHVLLLLSMPVLILLYVLRIVQGSRPLEPTNIVLLGIIATLLLVRALMKSGAIRLAGYLYIGVLWLASTLLAWSGNGIRGTGFVSYFIVMLLAAMLLGVRPAIGVAFLSILSGFGFAYLESIGRVVYRVEPSLNIATEFTVLFTFGMMIIVLIMNSLQNALRVARINAEEVESNNRELREIRNALEIRVQERTASLERRAAQLQTVSSLARSIASMQDLNALLLNIVRLASDQFGFYHAAIFLLDDNDESALLKASNSDGGRRMLNRGHRIARDSNSIVGYVMIRGEPRVALDVGTDPLYFNNPELPETRSELALPLRVSGRVIGALDVQSTETNAFSQEDVAVLTTLADQIAIAIENYRLYGEAQNALSNSQATVEQYVRQSWSSFVQQAKHVGFVYDGKHTTALDRVVRREQIRTAIQTGRLSLDKSSETLTIPIKLRGQTIGALEVRSKKGARIWSLDELTLLEAAAERAALALENARLVESAQRRAARERAIGEISAKIGAFSDVEQILQTAVEELGRKISGTTEVTMEIDADVSPQSTR